SPCTVASILREEGRLTEGAQRKKFSLPGEDGARTCTGSRKRPQGPRRRRLNSCRRLSGSSQETPMALSRAWIVDRGARWRPPKLSQYSGAMPHRRPRNAISAAAALSVIRSLAPRRDSPNTTKLPVAAGIGRRALTKKNHPPSLPRLVPGFRNIFKIIYML